MTRRQTELVIGGLASATAVNAAAGAIYGLSGAPGVPREWLADSPFRDYTVPSLVLGTAVGGSAAVAATTAWRADDDASGAAVVAGAVLMVWVVAQVGVIGLRSPLQPLMAGVGVALVGLGRRLA
jgi:hypothetical protein